jgi:hypothetical protein
VPSLEAVSARKINHLFQNNLGGMCVSVYVGAMVALAKKAANAP